MLSRLLIVCALVLMTGCATSRAITCKDAVSSVPASEIAKVYTTKDLELPPALDLEPYKVEPTAYKQFKSDDVLYIGVPETDMMKQNGMLLVLKNRIYELQEIIKTYNSSN